MEMVKLSHEEELDNLVEEFRLRVEEIREEMVEYELSAQGDHLKLTKLMKLALVENKELTEGVTEAQRRIERLEREINEEE